MKQNSFYYLAVSFCILTLASFQGCQKIVQPKEELTYIEDVSYDAKTQATLFTVQHTGGCNSKNYEYKYQILNSDVEQKSAELALFVNTNNKCKNKDLQTLQFIQMSLPELSFKPEHLSFKSSRDKEIIITSDSRDVATNSKSELEPQQEIASIEDAGYDPKTQKITLNIFLSNGCGGDYAHEYAVLSSDTKEKSVALALIVNFKDKCDREAYPLGNRGDYTSLEILLPKLPFKPKKIIFPSSEHKQIVLKIT